MRESVIVVLQKFFIHQSFVHCPVGTEQAFYKHAGECVLEETRRKGSSRWQEEEGSSWYVDFEELGFVFSKVPKSGYKFCITVPEMHPIRLRGLMSFAQIW